MASLELAAGLLGAGAIVVHAGGLAVVRDELHDEVDVIAAVLRQAVADRDPPLLAEAHLLDELARDLRPRLIRQRVLVGVQRQRAVPHVRVGALGAATVVDEHAAVLALAGNRHARGETQPGGVELLGDPIRRPLVELDSLPGLYPLAGDEMRIAVLAIMTGADEVAQKPPHPSAARDRRNQRPLLLPIRTPARCSSPIASITCLRITSSSASVDANNS